MKNHKKSLFIVVFLLTGFCASLHAAGNKSELGLDYLELTQNELLAEVMYEVEPKLIARYEKAGFGLKLQKSAATSLAGTLNEDNVYKVWMKFFAEYSSHTPLRFLELDKADYPNLWNFGELIRIRKEKEKSLRLYQALHGKEFGE